MENSFRQENAACERQGGIQHSPFIMAGWKSGPEEGDGQQGQGGRESQFIKTCVLR